MTIVEENGRLRCTFQGALDTAGCAKIAGPLQARAAAAKLPVVLDLTGVEFISSAFFRVCMTLGREIGSDKVSLENVSPMCRRLFKIAGLDSVFRIA